MGPPTQKETSTSLVAYRFESAHGGNLSEPKQPEPSVLAKRFAVARLCGSELQAEMRKALRRKLSFTRENILNYTLKNIEKRFVKTKKALNLRPSWGGMRRTLVQTTSP